MNSIVTLHSGRAISLRELRQRSTYEGLLEGLPTKERNRGLMQRLVKEGFNAVYRVPPLLLEPVERMIAMPPGEDYPLGTPASLPPVQTFARFESTSPTAGKEGDGSGLVVIWFQDEFGYPPPAEVLRQLELIDWETHAGSFEY